MSRRNTFSLRLSSGRTIALREGTKIGTEDIEGVETNATDRAFAAVIPNPTDPTILGLQNLSQQAWSATVPDGSPRRVEPGRSLKLAGGTTINFGAARGTIREEPTGFLLSFPSGQTVPLKEGTQLTGNALRDAGRTAPGGIAAQVVHNPNDPMVLGLKNVSDQSWLATVPDGSLRHIEPGRSLKLEAGTVINFGAVSGEIQSAAHASPFAFRLIPPLLTSRRAWVVSLCVAFLVLGSFAMSRFYSQFVNRSSSPDMFALAPEFASAKGLARIRSQPRSITVGPEGGMLSLDDGARLTVPPGALNKTTRLHAAIVDLAHERIASELQRAWVYVVATDEDFGPLAHPVVLDVPQPSDRVIVSLFEQGRWRALNTSPGPHTRIEITHFSVVKIFIALAVAVYVAEKQFDISSRAARYLESFAQRNATTNRYIEEVEPGASSTATRSEIEGSNEMTRAFFGVGEPAQQSMSQLCNEFKTVLRQFNKPDNLALPTQFKGQPVETNLGWLGGRIRRILGRKDISAHNDLTVFLQEADAPSKQRGPFYEIVAPSLGKIRERLVGQRAQISPAQFLKMCIEENGNNVPLGMLAAHNFLKDITYRGRDAYVPGVNMTEFGLPARKLQSWRQNQNMKASVGTYDKLGPLYHVFAAMTAAYWLPSFMGGNVDKMEAFLRTFKIGADRPDTEEGEADRCGVEIGKWAYSDLSNIEQTEAPPPPTTADPSGLDAWKTRMMCRDGIITGAACEKATQVLCRKGDLSGPQCERYM